MYDLVTLLLAYYDVIVTFLLWGMEVLLCLHVKEKYLLTFIKLN